MVKRAAKKKSKAVFAPGLSPTPERSKIQGKYRVILADPPWEYSNRNVNGAAEDHYPTLRPSQIKALPVADLAADDAVLVLWSTNPMLPEALDVIRSWGFTYVTKLPWVKFIGDPQLDKDGQIVEGDLAWGTGWWARGCSEDILLARRGHIRPPEEVAEGILGLLSKRNRHSAKPQTIYSLIERGWSGPYLELFARQQQPGWDIWGNDVESTLDIFQGLPPHYLQDKAIEAGLTRIRTLWETAESSRWEIGDILADLLKTTRYTKTELFRLAASQMRRVNSIWPPRLMYFVSLSFRGVERNMKHPWNYYRSRYETIRAEQEIDRQHRRKRMQDAREYVDKTYFMD